MQEIIVIAGPNGAGKTSFANKYLSSFRGRFVFLNADEVAREIALPDVPQARLDLRAGREMLARIDDCIAAGLNIAFETTLASLSYARKIPAWQQAGCSVALVYLRLPSVEMSIERVRRRVAQGGHGIPEDVIRKRFSKSLDYFERLYRPIVNEWYIWDSLEGSFRPAEKWDDR
jgi:predicted ABC-type ATPase